MLTVTQDVLDTQAIREPIYFQVPGWDGHSLIHLAVLDNWNRCRNGTYLLLLVPIPRSHFCLLIRPTSTHKPQSPEKLGKPKLLPALQRVPRPNRARCLLMARVAGAHRSPSDQPPVYNCQQLVYGADAREVGSEADSVCLRAEGCDMGTVTVTLFDHRLRSWASRVLVRRSVAMVLCCVCVHGFCCVETIIGSYYVLRYPGLTNDILQFTLVTLPHDMHETVKQSRMEQWTRRSL